MARIALIAGLVAFGGCTALPGLRDTHSAPRSAASTPATSAGATSAGATSAGATSPSGIAATTPPGAARVPSTSGSAPRFADTLTRLLGSATSMIGQPYRFGGAAPGGFDCSGLVVYAGAGAGLALPRTTREQVLAGNPVRRGDVRAGDLVFLRLRHRALHVGIALDALRFIHAPSRGGHVRIDALDRKPYAQAFVAARRILPVAPPTISRAPRIE